jgi:hypothetical protein
LLFLDIGRTLRTGDTCSSTSDLVGVGGIFAEERSWRFEILKYGSGEPSDHGKSHLSDRELI